MRAFVNQESLISAKLSLKEIMFLASQMSSKKMTDTKFGGNPHLLPPIPIKHMTRHAPAVKAIVNQSPKVSF